MKAYTKKSHVRESANDKIFEFVISLILILFVENYRHRTCRPFKRGS